MESIRFITGLENQLENIQDGQWLVFVPYRRFWSNEMNKFEINSLNDFLLETPKEWEDIKLFLAKIFI